MNVLLLGYYGKHNIGDDLFVNQLTHYLAQQESIDQVFVLCEENYYQQNSDKIQFLVDHQLSPWQRAMLILKSHCLVWGGGTLSISGKPRSLLKMQRLAQLTRKPFYFLGIGLEEIASQPNQSSLRLMRNSKLLYLRDQQSYTFALEHLKLFKDCLIGGDLAFLDLAAYQTYVKPYRSKRLKQLSFSGKFWWGEGRAEFYAQQLLPIVEFFDCKIHLLPGHVGQLRNDNQFHQKLIHYLPSGSYELHDWQYPHDFLATLSHMDFHIGNRLHSLIAADILGVPNIGIGSPASKIGHYIHRTSTLSELRLVDLMQPISVTTVELIFQQYRRPEAFIQQESMTSQACLEKVFLAG